MAAAELERPQWRRLWEHKFHQWLDKRAPRASEFRLNRNNLYTFPSTTGFVFLGLALILWMLGTNYQNNLILALAYTLVSVFIVVILHAYMNLAATRVQWLGAKPAFAGDDVQYVVELLSGNRAGCESVEVRFPGGGTQICNLEPGEPLKLAVPFYAAERGYVWPGRLLIQSYYPLGIIRCWSWLNLDAVAIVYPAPKSVAEPLSLSADTLEDGLRWEAGGEDFSGLKVYQAGDSIKHIAWKVYAQEKGLFSKEYSQPVGGDIWLDWNCVNLTDTEARLSGLCYWVLQYHRQGKRFGLRLPNTEVGIGAGDEHVQKCLQHLAIFNKPKP